MWKDRIYPIPSGKRLSTDTLDAVLNAFDFTEAHRNELWDLLAGNEPAVVTNPVLSQRQHQTITLEEFHYVGERGIPTHHETIHGIRSLVPMLRYVPYRFDTNEVNKVSVVHGGLASEMYRVDERTHAVDIVLDVPVPLNEVTSLRYQSSFSYQEIPEKAFRRVITDGVLSVGIHVCFHPQRLPRAVWWTSWSDWPEGSTVVTQDLVTLGPDNGVHHLLELPGACIVGFHWDFD